VGSILGFSRVRGPLGGVGTGGYFDGGFPS
jgi:hypothetical protein